MEDKANELRWKAVLAQAARTPQTKKDAQNLQSFMKKINSAIDDMVPWTSKSKNSGLHRKYAEQMEKSGKQVLVILDATDMPNDPLYKNAEIAK